MRNQPRDVTGGSQVLSGFFPGLNLVNYILGWFSVPIEVFLRWNFGERYFTWANFVAGFVVIAVFRFASSVLSALNPLSFLAGGAGDSPESWMGGVMKWYVIIGLLHFTYISVKDMLGNWEHSYSSGQSWLRPLGKLIMGFLNLLIGLVIRLLIRVIPQQQHKDRLADALPVLRDVDTFTERFVEPFVVFVFALMCKAAGQTSMFFWLLISVMALNFSTGMRHRAQRSYIQDIRDRIIEAQMMHDALHNKQSPGAERTRQFIQETAREAERTPEIIEVIERQNPTVAAAVIAINPKLKNAMRSNPNDSAMAA